MVLLKRLDVGSPAHAGMDPPEREKKERRKGLPRARGDGPFIVKDFFMRLKAPPRTRGWTRTGAPGHRGSMGSPAHAGMDLTWGFDSNIETRLPRARGDGA